MRSALFLFREFLGSLKQSKFLHLTYGAQVTVSLLVLGIFFVLLFGAVTVWGRLGQEMKVHVFLENDLDASAYLRLEEEINALENVESCKFRSKDDALEVFQESSNIPLSDLVGENPLPASYVIQVDRPANIEIVASQLEGMNGVWLVKFNATIVDRYLKVLLILGSICVITISLLLIFTFSSISNIIGLSIYARRTEIRIMQLVGATWWFIRWPFLFEGLFVGLVGAVVATLIIWGLMIMMGQLLQASQLDMVVPGLGISMNMMLLALSGFLVVLGLLIGFFGSLKVVNSFLGEENRIKLEAMRVKELMR